jgi:hypothetical protein
MRVLRRDVTRLLLEPLPPGEHLITSQERARVLLILGVDAQTFVKRYPCPVLAKHSRITGSEEEEALFLTLKATDVTDNLVSVETMAIGSLFQDDAVSLH